MALSPNISSPIIPYYPRISENIYLLTAPNIMRNYCCLNMENAVISGTVREEAFVNDRPEHNMYIIEIVTRKRINKKWLFMKEERIDTKEIILKNCLWCGAHLG